ncbi:MAG TPA: hypothetical protein VMS73_07455 [Anaerolineaceae bacterium]|nr:hypothetical protein [Anaerolineaceae bacterium]
MSVKTNLQERAALISVRSWQLRTVLEIIVIVAWAVWVGRDYLNFNPQVFPFGGDFPLQIYNHFNLNLIPQCGICALWNGSLNGGQPALIDLQGAAAHPLVILVTLLFGAVNGAKVYLLVSLVIAGLAQWWLARVMGLGMVARLWSGLIVVVSGHLGGRLDNGVINSVLSIAFASLILAPAVDLADNRNRKAIVWMGVALALTLVSGQGYIEVWAVAGLLPILSLFVLRTGHRPKILRDYILAGVLAVLLAGYFLVPVLHFFPSFTKVANPTFSDAQSINFMPINFLMDQANLPNVLRSSYVGWVPVILAFLAVYLAPRSRSYLLWFFLIGIAWTFILSSSEFLKFLNTFIPQIATLRFPNFINGMAVPFLLALSAWGLDLVIKLSWPRLSVIFGSGKTLTLTSSWVLVLIPLVLSILAAYPVGRRFMFTHVVERSQPVIQELKTNTASQWIRTPMPDFDFVPVLFLNGISKITGVGRPWGWIDHTIPEPFKEAVYPMKNPDGSTNPGTLGDYDILLHPENQYAAVDTGQGLIPCQSSARGGIIDVSCSTTLPGRLVVREHSWSGWYVWVDGKPAFLDNNQWLTLSVESGTHTIQFRYLPWDVLLGVLLTLAGVVLAVWIIKKQ